jgi:cell pole-organizing protein PopZ
MSSQSSQQTHEPTMEEILASIRKIISEDQAEPAPPPAPAASAPVAASRPAAAAPAAAPAPVAVEQAEEADEVADEEPEEEEIEILELTVEVQETSAVAAPVQAAAEDSAAPGGEAEAVAFDAAQTQEQAGETDMSGLISESTRAAMGKAFQPLEAQASEPAAPEYTAIDGSKLEAMFSGAINQAVTPAVQDWVSKNSGNMVQTMKPIIREWMDQNLPPLIEKAVKAEIAAAVRSLMQRR